MKAVKKGDRVRCKIQWFESDGRHSLEYEGKVKSVSMAYTGEPYYSIEDTKHGTWITNGHSIVEVLNQ